MDSTDDHYNILNVSRTSTLDEIKNAYRKLAIKYHPDKNLHRTLEAERMFKKISDAYTTLSNTKTRALYDKMAVDQPKSDPQQYDSREVFQAFFADHDPFSKLTVHDIHPFKSYKKLENTSTKKVSEDKNESNIELKCTLEDFFWGCEKRIKIERKNLCTKEEKDLTVRIEAGMKEGSSIVLRNEGDDRGDLVCTLKEQKHELFERDGSCSNLIYYCRISLLHALTGTSIKVPTLSGRILLLALPEVVHSKYERIVKGEGMPIYIGDKSFRGDLIIRFDVQYPKLNYTVREHLRALLCDIHERMD